MNTDNDYSLLPPLPPEMPVQSLSPAQAQAKTRFQKVFPIVMMILKIIGKVLLGLLLVIWAAIPEKKRQEEELSITDILTGAPYPQGNIYTQPETPKKHH